ncbi:MAG: septum site-determining protein MinD [Clostridiales bacterium]|nr:septum site-determining protein MinD [Clostridiales bacterium]
MGESIIIASGKDGTGKTVFAVNLAVTLAQRRAAVALVDLNLGMRGLDLALGLESSVIYDLGDVFLGVCSLRQACVADRRFEKLDLFSGPQDLRKADFTPGQIRGLFEELKRHYDYVIIDTAGGPAGTLSLAASGADRAILLVTPDQEALRNAETVNVLLRSKGIADRRLVVNKVRPEFFDEPAIPQPEAIVESLRLPLAGIIQYDANIQLSSNIGLPIVMEPGTYIADNFRRMAMGLVQPL